MRIVFMGTPDFAVPSLEMLVSQGYTVAAVVTQPDKPKGRGNKMSFPPVKAKAIEYGIPVLQPLKVKTDEFIQTIAGLKPDLLVTAAYGRILSAALLEVPRLGCINVHGSLLPKYRGAAPIQWAVINGEKATGITTMLTDAGMDTGDMLLKKEIPIPEDMTAGELYEKMSYVGAEVLQETLEKLKNGTLERVKQDDAAATKAPMLTKEHGHIDWEKSKTEIHNLVRGTNPWPSAYTFYKKERMRVWKTEATSLQNPGLRAGTISRVGSDGIDVACGDGIIKVLEVQFDSSRRMRMEEYLRGHAIDEGEILE